MKNPFKRSTPEPEPAPPAPAAPQPPPAPQLPPSAPTIYYHGVSNSDWRGLPVGYSGLPADTQMFRSFAEARAWLVSLRCGGTIYNSRDDRTQEILPGAD